MASRSRKMLQEPRLVIESSQIIRSTGSINGVLTLSPVQSSRKNALAQQAELLKCLLQTFNSPVRASPSSAPWRIAYLKAANALLRGLNS
jgi:hypothetical protein